jgi:hypothetical protein
MASPTPGEIAYAAYHQGAPLPWSLLPAYEQRSWEAAAQAVRKDTLGFQFPLGSHVRRTIDPEHIWEIWWRACREERDRTVIDYGRQLVNPETDYHPCAVNDSALKGRACRCLTGSQSRRTDIHARPSAG